jgi:uncharacterized membrane protein
MILSALRLASLTAHAAHILEDEAPDCYPSVLAAESRSKRMAEPSTDNNKPVVTAEPPVVSNYGLVLAVYILYLVGFLTGITALVGVIIAYLQRDKTDQLCRSHFQFQITTFWLGLLYLVVGAITAHFAIGALILIWWFIWTIIRCVKGLLALNEGKPIPQPNSWWFGE